MPVWERYQGDVGLTTVNTHFEASIFNNDVSDNFQQADVVAVDGIVTIHTDSDDLFGYRLLILPNQIVAADVDENNPTPDNQQVWYSFFCARGPTIFRLRSKKTVPPNNQLWWQVWKASGSTASTLRWGLQVLWVLKH